MTYSSVQNQRVDDTKRVASGLEREEEAEHMVNNIILSKGVDYMKIGEEDRSDYWAVFERVKIVYAQHSFLFVNLRKEPAFGVYSYATDSKNRRAEAILLRHRLLCSIL